MCVCVETVLDRAGARRRQSHQHDTSSGSGGARAVSMVTVDGPYVASQSPPDDFICLLRYHFRHSSVMIVADYQPLQYFDFYLCFVCFFFQSSTP